ncbi:Cthe_2314 family HEPN domain-containing protein [Rhodocyclus tenuis]|uniref:Cthe_2314 family HEPN domain-containing protein n=1 Tax=Rhodocyclus tenuis TaxID=1066 RepID=UPI001908D035|nr:Cthe_2314 family HEPN domain-containing protein [Rhodocyclus tenuis]MBK1681281.1 hypothetical protein [Rhodocyclus tenuis]
MDRNDKQEQRSSLIDHPGLTVLMPHLRRYLHKGLAELRSSGTTFPTTAAETYAAGVAERVSELDNALQALRLTLDFVMALVNQPSPNPDVYSYHYENFVLRVIGFVDRAHRLVGAALLLDKAKFESVGGNKFVQAQVKTEHPDIHAALLGVMNTVENYRGPRNELIHSAAFSSREIGLFRSIRQFRVGTEGVDIDALERRHYAEGSEEITLTITRLVKALTTLLDCLASRFIIISTENDQAIPKKRSDHEGAGQA